jgi:hypothetical protein
MPKLILFAACERVLIDQRTNSATLIGALEEMHFKLPPGSLVLPANTALPTQWAIFALWQEEPEDVGLEFEQRVTVENATGQIVIYNIAKFNFQQKRQRVVSNVVGLPYSRQLLLNLFCHVAGIPDWGRPLASYPIEVVQDAL